MKKSTLASGRRTAPSRTMGGISSAKPNMKGDRKEHKRSRITKIGPWGGKTGQSHQTKVEPACLNSITIRSGETIQAIAFSYSDMHGNLHHEGPWGANGGHLAGGFHTILLGPSEYLIKISGAVGMSSKYSSDVVTSLMFTTNISVYGPFGEGGGIPFDSQLTSNDSIVGFFVRAMGLVDAIGIYVNPVRDPIVKQALITKMGPWGGDKGSPSDLNVLPRRLVSVVVRYNEDVIDSIAFTYSDCDGQQHSGGPWGALGGSHEGTIHTIVLGRSEYLKEICGTVGPSPNNADVVTSLLFVTNIGSYGPFGGGGGIPFSSPKQNNVSIVGFFVREGRHVDAIGVYVEITKEELVHDIGGTSSANPNQEDNLKELNKPCITKIGMWGGHKGSPCDTDVAPVCLNNITICSGEVVHSLAFSYSDDHGKQHHAGPWGVSQGTFDVVCANVTLYLFWSNKSSTRVLTTSLYIWKNI